MSATPPTRILLVTSNGTGMGHLTRQVSIALAGGEGVQTHLFSLSLGLGLVSTHGIPGEYCPSYDRPWMPSREWHSYLRERLISLVRELDIQVIAFDGVAPYPGIGQARPHLPGVTFAWIRRGMWRPGVNTIQLKKASMFDLIIEPLDLASDADHGATVGLPDVVRVPPISMLDVVPRLPRSQAASALGIDPDRPTALVTLGSGRLGDVEGPGATALAALLEQPDWQICVTKPAVASKRVPVIDPMRVKELRNVYPLVSYLDAFDLAISAAGYNATHELVPVGIPTLLIPNTSTKTDDQAGRAEYLAAQGLCLVADGSQPGAIAAQIDELIKEDTRQRLRTATQGLLGPDGLGGAAATAHALQQHAGRLVGAKRTIIETWRRADMATREALKGLLGPAAVDRIRRIRGTTGPDLTTRRLKVAVTKTVPPAATGNEPDVVPLLITDQVTTEILRYDHPVEHVLPGTSGHYRRARRKIIHKHFGVVSGDEHLA